MRLCTTAVVSCLATRPLPPPLPPAGAGGGCVAAAAVAVCRGAGQAPGGGDAGVGGRAGGQAEKRGQGHLTVLLTRFVSSSSPFPSSYCTPVSVACKLYPECCKRLAKRHAGKTFVFQALPASIKPWHNKNTEIKSGKASMCSEGVWDNESGMVRIQAPRRAGGEGAFDVAWRSYGRGVGGLCGRGIQTVDNVLLPNEVGGRVQGTEGGMVHKLAMIQSVGDD